MTHGEGKVQVGKDPLEFSLYKIIVYTVDFSKIV
jgi:hypothetical protein